jgi:hypothetical protein
MPIIRARTPTIVLTMVASSAGLVSESPLPGAFEEPVSVGEEPKPSLVAIPVMSDGLIDRSIGKVPVLDQTPWENVVKVPCPTLPAEVVVVAGTKPFAQQ